MNISKMKKLYIQPTVEVEKMETLEMIADSGDVTTDDAVTNKEITEEDKTVDPNLTGGNGNFGNAKGNNLWGFDNAW